MAFGASCRSREATSKVRDFAARFCPGERDWLLLRADGVLELDLRITLETDDHALIYMRFQGLRHGPPEVIAALGRGEVVDPASYYFRTLPRFETSTDRYAFLNRIISRRCW